MEPVFETYLNDYNSDHETGLRRYRGNLAMSGAAYVVFGFWSVIKIIVSLTMEPEIWEDMLKAGREVEGATDDIIKPVFAVIMILICAVILFIHIRIGLSAIRYSSKKQRSWFFLIVAAFLIYLTVTSIPNYFEESIDPMYSAPDVIASSILADLTVCFALFDMIFSIIMIGRIRRRKKREGAQG